MQIEKQSRTGATHEAGRTKEDAVDAMQKGSEGGPDAARGRKCGWGLIERQVDAF